ncbi:hypothetical protein FBZ96_1204 [Bradyrhizobium stylosanthis]|uniref:Apea-like HEPN domain-containing protein n=2 Tax=Bradyrhizobium stylosanthis TaxID=1803665 RepID=A0A560CX11_9BRAD|nr:hypothetical protein FBZ96_1204 [Bradyrhizobium stylosanthis]
MPQALTREVGLLRAIAGQLEQRPLPFEQVTQEFLRKEGLGHVREKAGNIISLGISAHQAFGDLTDCLRDRYPAMERGSTYADVQTELFSFIEAYVGREPSTIATSDAEALLTRFEHWFAQRASSRRVFVPCLITRTAAPRFEIGPVTFEFINRIRTSDFWPSLKGEASLDRHGFEDLLKWMHEGDAYWLARVSVDGCEQRRAEEIAELAVDLAIVALQLSAPALGTSTMARLDARRGTSQKRTLSEAGGYHNAGWTRKEPGLTIGRGTLEDILLKSAQLIAAVGNLVQSFASGSFRLPTLERAWCDAAYWLHQARAESIDTIAIAKLETALEVLFCSESARGSEQRILGIFHAFFGLAPDAPINPGSLISARQFARRIVRDRSRILHGTWSTLNARGLDRAGIEGFVISVVRMAAVELDAYAHSPDPSDDIDEFLHWMKKRRGALA